jgi:peroxiredoxin
VLKPGQPAPDFPVGGETLRALLARGPVVVFFFPKAFTPG